MSCVGAKKLVNISVLNNCYIVVYENRIHLSHRPGEQTSSQVVAKFYNTKTLSAMWLFIK